MSFSEMLVAFALKQLGKPYLWAGRGDYVVREHQIIRLADTDQGFDCAGLVTWAAWKAGAADLRGWYGADHLWLLLPEGKPGDMRLALYGSKGHATHVAIDLGHGLVLEAAGGDSTTLTVTDAMKRGASVRIGFERRVDRLGYRSLEALKDLPLRPTVSPTP